MPPLLAVPDVNVLFQQPKTYQVLHRPDQTRGYRVQVEKEGKTLTEVVWEDAVQ